MTMKMMLAIGDDAGHDDEDDAGNEDEDDAEDYDVGAEDAGDLAFDPEAKFCSLAASRLVAALLIQVFCHHDDDHDDNDGIHPFTSSANFLFENF